NGHYPNRLLQGDRVAVEATFHVTKWIFAGNHGLKTDPRVDAGNPPVCAHHRNPTSFQDTLEIVGALHTILTENGTGIGKGRWEPTNWRELSSNLQLGKTRQIGIEQSGAVRTLMTHAAVTVTPTRFGHSIKEQ